MLTTARDLIRLAIAARVIARHDGFIEPEQMAELPPQIRFALGFARMGRAPVRAGQGGLAEALIIRGVLRVPERVRGPDREPSLVVGKRGAQARAARCVEVGPDFAACQ